jgi:hypothetical protein
MSCSERCHTPCSPLPKKSRVASDLEVLAEDSNQQTTTPIDDEQSSDEEFCDDDNLPPGWIRGEDESGEVYHYNRVTEIWERPLVPALPEGWCIPRASKRTGRLFYAKIGDQTGTYKSPYSRTQEMQKKEMRPPTLSYRQFKKGIEAIISPPLPGAEKPSSAAAGASS